MKLSTALKKASTKVWSELTPISNLSHKIYEIREEGLTSMALKELSFSKCKNIQVIEMISAKRESIDGYDFQISLGNDKNAEYITFYIQAKRLSGSSLSSKYAAIDKDQVKNLIAYSCRRGVPSYAFFNHLMEPPRTLRSYYNSITSFNKKYLGITLASAHAVRLANDYSFLTYHQGSGPNLPRKVYSPSNLANLFGYFKNQMNIAVPFHELAYMNVKLAKAFNKRYKENSRRSTLPFFFFNLGFEDFFFDNEDLIPIVSTTSQRIIAEFSSPSGNIRNDIFSPQALIIINT